MNQFGIDVETHDKARLIRRLRRLKTTHEVQDHGEYCQDRGYSRIHLVTDWTEEQLEDWLWWRSNTDYVGVFHAQMETA